VKVLRILLITILYNHIEMAVRHNSTDHAVSLWNFNRNNPTSEKSSEKSSEKV